MYQTSYNFIEKQGILSSKQEQLYDKFFLLENLTELNLRIPKYCIDILPAPMRNPIFFEEFDYDRNSGNSLWRSNYHDYFIKFRKFLYTIIGYSQITFVETTFFEEAGTPAIIQINTKGDKAILEEIIVNSLNEYDNTLISFPEEQTVLIFSGLFIQVITTNGEMLDRMKLIATTNGLYCHLMIDNSSNPEALV